MIEKLHRRPSRDSEDSARHTPPGPRTKGPAERAFGGLLSLAAGFVYPSLCPSCGEGVAAQGGLCSSCWRGVTFIAGPACRVCGAPMEADGGLEAVCDGCAHAPPAWSRGAAATVYDGVARRLALALKHGDRLDVAPIAGQWMARAAPDLIAAADIIAPAPLAWSRMVKRRYNQAGELAREVALEADRAPALALDLISRARRTESQGVKSRKDRFANMLGAFAPGPSARRAAGARVLLIDDVLTTGATLSGCAEACRAAGAVDVTVLVFARVARADWAP